MNVARNMRLRFLGFFDFLWSKNRKKLSITPMSYNCFIYLENINLKYLDIFL